MKEPTDSDLLDRLEAAILRGLIVWDGVGKFEWSRANRPGLGLMHRSLREAIKQGCAELKESA